MEKFFFPLLFPSSGSSRRVRGAEKHEIYATAFGGHLFYDLFSQGWGGGGGIAPSAPADPLLILFSINNSVTWE